VETTRRKERAPQPDLKEINHDNMEALELYQRWHQTPHRYFQSHLQSAEQRTELHDQTWTRERSAGQNRIPTKQTPANKELHCQEHVIATTTKLETIWPSEPRHTVNEVKSESEQRTERVVVSKGTRRQCPTPGIPGNALDQLIKSRDLSGW